MFEDNIHRTECLNGPRRDPGTASFVTLCWSRVFVFADLCFIERGKAENFSWSVPLVRIAPLTHADVVVSAGACHPYRCELGILTPLSWTADILTEIGLASKNYFYTGLHPLILFIIFLLLPLDGRQEGD